MSDNKTLRALHPQPKDISYAEVPPDQIRRMNEHASEPQPTSDNKELVERLRAPLPRLASLDPGDVRFQLGADYDYFAIQAQRDEAADALERAERTQERMWCESCGTVTRDGHCDCTAPHGPGGQRLQNYADMLCAQLHQYKADFEARIAKYQERLEIDHVWETRDGKRIKVYVPPDQRDRMIDGIDCRDETIRLQDERIAELEAERQQDVARAIRALSRPQVEK